MFLKGAACAGLLLLNGLAMAQRVERPDGVGTRQTPQAGLTEPAGDAGVDQGALRPSRTPRKQPFVNRIPVDHMGRLVIKVIDAADTRALPDGNLISLTNRDINDLQAIIQRHGLSLVRAINHSDQVLAQLEGRAAALSGYGQLRLASIMYVEGDEDDLLAALQELKASGNIDWAEWDTKLYTAQVPSSEGPVTGACCLPNFTCEDGTTQDFCEGILQGLWSGPGTTCETAQCPGACCIEDDGICLDFIPQARCEAAPPQGFGGVFQGAFSQCAELDCGFTGACCLGTGDCMDGLTEEECLAQPGGFWGGPGVPCEDPDTGEMLDCDVMCGHPFAGDCFLLDGNGTPFCDDEECCDAICDIDPFCCIEDGGEWDLFCAANANLMCDNPGADTCLSAINGSCFQAHSTPGCNVEPCCNVVCLIDPFCCELGFDWDNGCVALAFGACLADPDTPLALDPREDTPLLTSIQGYRTPESYNPADIPPDLLPFIPLLGGLIPLEGYGGEGWLLMEQEPFTDANGNGDFDCGESFEDWNGNGVHDYGGDPFVDGETFTDVNGNGSWDPGEPFIDDNPVNGAFDAPNCHYDRLSPFSGGAEQFFDRNFNGVYDAGDPYAGVYGLGQQLLDVFGVDNSGQGNLALGKTIKTAVIEWAYWGAEPFTDVNGNGQYDVGEPFIDSVTNGVRDPGHEELDVILEAGQTLIQEPEITNPDHGTATLSIINAKADGKGITGIAPEAQAYFFPLTSVEEGSRGLTAWVSAMLVLGPGDVISASYGPSPANLNTAPASWAMIRLASDLGITCCISAGNDCFNLDGAADLGDSGGIVVAYGSPGRPYYRLLDSNYCTAPTLDRGNIVHVKAWGARVASAGYGTMFNGNPFDLDGDGLFGEDPIDGIDNDGDGAFDEDPPPLPQLRVSRRYTNDFGQSSSAAPQIAGLVACLQGLAKQFYGIALMPDQIRSALGAPGAPPPSSPTPRLFGGFPGPGCALDFDPDLGPNRSGSYPVAAGNFGSAASTILNQGGFNDAPLVDGINILRGRLIYGNVFSIKASDNNYLVLKGVRTNPTSPPQVPSASGVNPTYLGFGLVTDVEVLAHAPEQLTAGMTVQVETRSEGATTSLMFVDMFDWRTGRWTFVGLAFPLDVDEVPPFEFAVGNSGRFIRKSDDLVLIRVWTIALGNTSGDLSGDTGTVHIMRHDLINLDAGGGGGIFGPGGGL